MNLQGTRQNRPVILGEGVPSHRVGHSDQTQASVYQNQRPLQSCKTMYGAQGFVDSLE